MTERPPARLDVIFARDVPRALILRIGPSKHTRMILWDTRHDTFEDGQWVKHRIYSERCALSPDGRHVVYAGFRALRPDRRTLGGYTAIARPPYFTALWFHAQEDTWGGGGTFVDNRHVWLHLPYPGGALSLPAPEGLTPVYDPRTHPAYDRDAVTAVNRVPEFLVTADGQRARIKRADLERLRDSATQPGFRPMFIGHGQPDWPEWCQIRNGCLFRRHADGSETLLRDFNPMRFEPIVAPYSGVPVRRRSSALRTPAFFKRKHDPALPND